MHKWFPWVSAQIQVCSINVTSVYECVKEGVFLEDKGMLVGACQALEGSVAVRISVAFVRIYSHNKDLVGDTWAGCVYIKETSQRGAAAMHQETLLLLCGRAGRKLGLMFVFFLKGKNKSRQCLWWVRACRSTAGSMQVCGLCCVCADVRFFSGLEWVSKHWHVDSLLTLILDRDTQALRICVCWSVTCVGALTFTTLPQLTKNVKNRRD